MPRSCPLCGSESTLHISGVGIEKLKEMLELVLPAARIDVISSDTSSPSRLKQLSNLEAALLIL